MNPLAFLGLSKIEGYVIVAVAAVLIVGGGVAYIYHKGEKSGATAVESAVEKKAVEEIDTARKQKEQADEKAKRTPDSNLIERTR